MRMQTPAWGTSALLSCIDSLLIGRLHISQADPESRCNAEAPHPDDPCRMQLYSLQPAILIVSVGKNPTIEWGDSYSQNPR